MYPRQGIGDQPGGVGASPRVTRAGRGVPYPDRSTHLRVVAINSQRLDDRAAAVDLEWPYLPPRPSGDIDDQDGVVRPGGQDQHRRPRAGHHGSQPRARSSSTRASESGMGTPGTSGAGGHGSRPARDRVGGSALPPGARRRLRCAPRPHAEPLPGAGLVRPRSTALPPGCRPPPAPQDAPRAARLAAAGETSTRWSARAAGGHIVRMAFDPGTEPKYGIVGQELGSCLARARGQHSGHDCRGRRAQPATVRHAVLTMQPKVVRPHPEQVEGLAHAPRHEVAAVVGDHPHPRRRPRPRSADGPPARPDLGRRPTSGRRPWP